MEKYICACVCFSLPIAAGLSPLSRRVCSGVDLCLRHPLIAMVTPSGRRLWHFSLPCPRRPTRGLSAEGLHKIKSVSFTKSNIKISSQFGWGKTPIVILNIPVLVDLATPVVTGCNSVCSLKCNPHQKR